MRTVCHRQLQLLDDTEKQIQYVQAQSNPACGELTHTHKRNDARGGEWMWTTAQHQGAMAEQLSDFKLAFRDPANDHLSELPILSQNLRPIYLQLVSRRDTKTFIHSFIPSSALSVNQSMTFYQSFPPQIKFSMLSFCTTNYKSLAGAVLCFSSIVVKTVPLVGPSAPSQHPPPVNHNKMACRCQD